MKKFIITKCMNYIKKNTDYNDIKLQKIKYGLEGLYLTLTKMIIIVLIAIVLGILREVLIFMLLYSILRSLSFGLHATKSWICLISSTILFIGLPYLCIFLSIPIYIKIIIGILAICIMFKNAPADTKKRPIVSKKRRRFYKITSTLFAILFTILSIITKDNFISNSLLLSIIMQDIMISPIIYKIFKLPYNNYITFLKEHPNFVQ